MSKIGIRKATADDSSFLAKSILKSTRGGHKSGVFDLVFDSENEADLLEKIKLLINSEAKLYCHYSNFLIASMDNEAVATLCSYEPRISTPAKVEESLAQIGVSRKYGQSIDAISTCIVQKDKRVWTFDFLTIAEGYGGLEVLNELLKKSLLTASLKGYRVARAVVRTDAMDTILLYKKVGFQYLLKERCELFEDDFAYDGLTLLEMHF